MRVTALSLVFALLLGSAGSAWGAPVLFGDFVWGTPKSELAKRPELSPGDEYFADTLLLPEAIFASLPWNVRLEFENERLAQVSLMERYSRERMDAVTKQLQADKFEMLSVLIDSTYLDLVKTLKLLGPDKVREEWVRFVQDNVKDKAPERMVYAWFDTSGANRDIKTMASSLQQLLMMIPAETREAQVVLLHDPATSAPGIMVVTFAFPLMHVMQGREPQERETVGSP